MREKTEVISAIRITDTFAFSPAATTAHFFAVTFLRSAPMDFQEHLLKIQMVGQMNDQWITVGEAPDSVFKYNYTALAEPVTFHLTTEFNLTLAPLERLGTYYVQALLDGEIITQTPLTLRRA